MYAHVLVGSLLLAASLLAAAPPAMRSAVGTKAATQLDHPTAALAFLQRTHSEQEPSFVIQDELDAVIHEGGGPCASAAGIDALAALHVMAGLGKLPHPHKAVLASFADQKDLLKGRVTNEQFVRLIQFYQRYLKGTRLAVEVESAPNSVHRKPSYPRVWTREKGPDLRVARNQLKVISFTVSQPGGQVIGRHFALLKANENGHIAVVDPYKPLIDHTFEVQSYLEPKEGPRRVYLLKPAAERKADDLICEINTIYTITIADPPVTVEQMKHHIDETAKTLRGTRDYLNPVAWRRQTAKVGLPGLDLPTEVGGSSWRASQMIEIFRHAGSHNLNFRDIVGGAHVRPLLKSKSKVVQEIVRQVAAGKGYIAIAITEPEAGSDVPAIQSTAKAVKGGYKLTGEKKFNARLDQASHVILFTRGTSGKEGELSVFVVPITHPGLKIKKLEAHGLTGNSYGGLEFKDMFVKEEFRIGEDGKGMDLFTEHFLYWRLMQTAAAIGTAENALQQMADRIKTRKAFGGPIGRFTHLQQPLGQHTTELRMAYSLVKEAAALIDRGEYAAARGVINGLKAEGVETALKAVDAAMRAFGGMGYSTEVDLGDRLRDLQGLRIADGTTDVMRMDVVRWRFGAEFWEMAIQPKGQPSFPERK
jgi:alkylation response protein AidB-like acyl-CoA dehydrogenase